MVDFISVAVVYLAVAAGMIALLLFGESPLFYGTPIAWAHWAVTDGLWSGLEWLVVKVGGPRVKRWLDHTLECCCDRPSHVLQVSYVLLVAILYGMYWANLFVLLPNDWVGEVHKVTGTLTVVVCGVTFVAACMSDPGTITTETLPAHAHLFPCDNIVWHEKTCVTCKWARPARSKHCRICRRCVSRHDHHCGWINNCVGLLNHRLFLLFLLANLIMTLYGSVLGVFILLGQADRFGRLRYVTWDYQTGTVKAVYWPAARVVEWLMVVEAVPSAVTLFMAAAVILVSFFLGYQLHMISTGVTQYELYRWRAVWSAVKLQQLHDSDSTSAPLTEHQTINSAPSQCPSDIKQRMGDRAVNGGDTAAAADDDDGDDVVAGGSAGRSTDKRRRRGTVQGAAATREVTVENGNKDAVGSRSTRSTSVMGGGNGCTKEAKSTSVTESGRRRDPKKRGMLSSCLIRFGRRVGWLQQRDSPDTRGKPADEIVLKNMYDRGTWGNFSEILFPYHHLRRHGLKAR